MCDAMPWGTCPPGQPARTSPCLVHLHVKGSIPAASRCRRLGCMRLSPVPYVEERPIRVTNLGARAQCLPALLWSCCGCWVERQLDTHLPPHTPNTNLLRHHCCVYEGLVRQQELPANPSLIIFSVPLLLDMVPRFEVSCRLCCTSKAFLHVPAPESHLRGLAHSLCSQSGRQSTWTVLGLTSAYCQTEAVQTCMPHMPECAVQKNNTRETTQHLPLGESRNTCAGGAAASCAWQQPFQLRTWSSVFIVIFILYRCSEIAITNSGAHKGLKCYKAKSLSRKRKKAKF